MEREKMIEEIAKDIHNAKRASDYHCYEDEYTDCKKCKLLKYAENKMCQDAYEACWLIDDGYQKVPEGAIVLTKEELVKTMENGYVYDTTSGNKINFIEMAREIERKETAKEILQTLWEWKDRETALSCDLYELAEKYGVEVEE